MSRNTSSEGKRKRGDTSLDKPKQEESENPFSVIKTGFGSSSKCGSKFDEENEEEYYVEDSSDFSINSQKVDVKLQELKPME